MTVTAGTVLILRDDGTVIVTADCADITRRHVTIVLILSLAGSRGFSILCMVAAAAAAVRRFLLRGPGAEWYGLHCEGGCSTHHCGTLQAG